MVPITVTLQKEKGFEDLPLPRRQTSGASGYDLCAAIEQSMTIPPGEVRLVSAGFRMAIPEGFEAQIRPRSGLALNSGIGVLNSPGTIDPDYRGVVGVVMMNFGKRPFVINRGDRIAQMVFLKTTKVDFVETEQLESSQRGQGGFGSTGTETDE